MDPSSHLVRTPKGWAVRKKVAVLPPVRTVETPVLKTTYETLAAAAK